MQFTNQLNAASNTGEQVVITETAQQQRGTLSSPILETVQEEQEHQDQEDVGANLYETPHSHHPPKRETSM